MPFSDPDQLPDEVPIADAVEQQRDAGDPPDDDGVLEPPQTPPLEASAPDWREQLETVDVDPEEVRDDD